MYKRYSYVNNVSARSWEGAENICPSSRQRHWVLSHEHVIRVCLLGLRLHEAGSCSDCCQSVRPCWDLCASVSCWDCVHTSVFGMNTGLVLYKVTGENREGVAIIVWPFHDPCRFKQHSDTYYPLAMHAWLHRGEVRWADKHSGQAHDDGSLRLYTTNSDFSNATLRGRVTHDPQWRGW